MGKTFCVTVWNWFKKGLIDYHGGVLFPLHSKEIATDKMQWYCLKKEIVSEAFHEQESPVLLF